MITAEKLARAQHKRGGDTDYRGVKQPGKYSRAYNGGEEENDKRPYRKQQRQSARYRFKRDKKPTWRR